MSLLINNYDYYLQIDARNIYFYLPPKNSPIIENMLNKLNIKYVEYMGTCQKLGYCRLKAKKKKCSSYKKPSNQIELPFE